MKVYFINVFVKLVAYSTLPSKFNILKHHNLRNASLDDTWNNITTLTLKSSFCIIHHFLANSGRIIPALTFNGGRIFQKMMNIKQT